MHIHIVTTMSGPVKDSDTSGEQEEKAAELDLESVLVTTVLKLEEIDVDLYR